jgi:hypothetical protein
MLMTSAGIEPAIRSASINRATAYSLYLIQNTRKSFFGFIFWTMDTHIFHTPVSVSICCRYKIASMNFENIFASLYKYHLKLGNTVDR